MSAVNSSDPKIERPIQIAERLLRELDHKIPPQTETLEEVRKILAD